MIHYTAEEGKVYDKLVFPNGDKYAQYFPLEGDVGTSYYYRAKRVDFSENEDEPDKISLSYIKFLLDGGKIKRSSVDADLPKYEAFDGVQTKANNSLQKPEIAPTKTKLVGVGASGQENIEIGDNLTLANGKLSATGGIPVVEGTESTTTTDGAYATYTIPEAQTSCFIFKCDLGAAFISYNDVFGTYNGYLDAEGDVTDGSLKLNDLIVLSGSGTSIDIFFGQLGGGGGGNVVTIEVASMPDTKTTIEVTKITNDTQFVNIKETSTNKNYLLYRVGDDFASCFSNEFVQGTIVAYYYIDTQQKQLYYFISSVGKLGKIFGNHDIQVPAVGSANILPCTASDNGKVLSVVNGEAQWASASGGVIVTFED